MIRELITMIVFAVIIIAAVALALGVKCDPTVQKCLEDKK